MNSILSVLMALIMLMNMGGLITENLSSPVYFDVTAETDAATLTQAVGILSGQEDLSALTEGLTIAADVMNTIGVRGIAAKGGMQLELNSKEENILSLGFTKDENGLTAASNLLGNTRITVSPETVEQLNADMASTFGQPQTLMEGLNLDQEKAVADLRQAVDGAVAKIAEKAGEFESGEYFLEEEFLFSRKAAVDITYPELMTAILDAAEGFFSAEEYQSLYAAAGESSNPLSFIQKKREELANLDPSQYDDLSATLYENEDGERLITADMQQTAAEENQLPSSTNLYLFFGTENACTRLGLRRSVDEDTPAQAYLSAAGAHSLTLILDIPANEGQSLFANVVRTENLDSAVVGVRLPSTFIRALIDAAPAAEGGTSFTVDLLVDDENGDALYPLKLTGTSGQGGELSLFASADGVQTVAMETLMSDGEEAQEALSSLSFTLMIEGMTVVLPKLINALPEGTAAYVQQLLE
ncbi:MAG: hypothetical protein IKE24_00005 [Clostridia bacterium]|nr:hypothetical protein [Clostridia bacterium]